MTEDKLVKPDPDLFKQEKLVIIWIVWLKAVYKDEGFQYFLIPYLDFVKLR